MAFDRVSLGITYLNVFEGSAGSMDDYDWLYSNLSEYTNWSESDIFFRNSYHINAALAIKIFKNTLVTPIAGIGLTVMQWDWTDKAYDYIYTSSSSFPDYSPGDPLQDIEGSFGGQNSIDYRVTHTIPYLSLGGLLEFSIFNLEIGVLYSPFAESRGKDHHILRNLVFYDKAEMGQFWEIYASLSAVFYQCFQLRIGVGKQFILENRGTTSTYSDSGTFSGNSDDGGFAYDAFYFTFSLGVIF